MSRTRASSRGIPSSRGIRSLWIPAVHSGFNISPPVTVQQRRGNHMWVSSCSLSPSFYSPTSSPGIKNCNQQSTPNGERCTPYWGMCPRSSIKYRIVQAYGMTWRNVLNDNSNPKTKLRAWKARFKRKIQIPARKRDQDLIKDGEYQCRCQH